MSLIDDDVLRRLEEVRGNGLALDGAACLAVSNVVMDEIKREVREIADPQGSFLGMPIVASSYLPDHVVVGLKANGEVAFIWNVSPDSADHPPGAVSR